MSYESRDQIFYYHGYALGLGGFIERKGTMLAIPSVGSAALSVAGGNACVQSGPFSWTPPCDPPPEQGGFSISVDSVTSQLSAKEDKDFWTTEAEVRITNFNLCNRVKVGLMVNRMVSQHKKRLCPTFDPEKDHQPRIMVGESQYFNVLIDGEPIDVRVDQGLDQYARHAELQTFMNQNQAYCNHSLTQCGTNAPEYVQDLVHKHTSPHLTRSSIVQPIPPPQHDRYSVHGYSIDIPNFGRIFFGEMHAADRMKRLNMIRWNLGCDNCGDGSGATGDMNGLPMP